MAYVAMKPCRFAGRNFRIGESIPDELVHPGAAKNLLKMGVIAAQETEGAPAAAGQTMSGGDIEVLIRAEEGDMPLALTAAGLQSFVDVLTSKVGEAETIIKEMTDGDALILLHIADSRKSIKEAAEERAKELNAPQEDADSAADDQEDEAGTVDTPDDESAPAGQEGAESGGED